MVDNVVILIPTTPQRRERLAKCVEAIRENTYQHHMVMTYENNVGWVRAVITMLEAIDPEQLVVILNDDCLPQREWLKILVATYRDTSAQLLQPNDGIMHGAVATMPFAKAGYLLERLHSGYISYYADTELTDIARKAGEYLYVPDAVIFHEHHTNGKAVKDETYMSQEVNLAHDRDLYQARQCI